MNRLAPLIVRRPAGYAAAAAMPAPRPRFEPFGDPPPTASEWRLFASSFLAGFVFFGTLIA
jgi:hypothetical protein